MPEQQVLSGLQFKHELEQEFEAATGLAGRAHYSAIYSIPQRSPVVWINLNPGGTPDDHKVLSDDQLATGRHEFWHGHGRTSQATGAFLQRIFEAPLDRLRSVQGTNVAWERSRKGGDIDLRASAARAAPFLARYIRHVGPSHLVFGGARAFDLFIDVHQAGVVGDVDVLRGNWGRHQARLFSAIEIAIEGLGRFRTMTVSHPSRGVRAGVLERCRAHLSGVTLPFAIT
ncbi:hypothetical protein [uncultured Sphingomonas sp.]|uniref:hypothetical protein n=1 Tax=uncultured Sphingomonas sp. TaxID=158754 RepID=UPI0025ED04A0|nr:hypothetical protein [uncultured Sphingomonas sp.]